VRVVEPVDGADPAHEDDEGDDTVAELLDELRREVGALAVLQARSAALRHREELRRAASGLVLVLALVVAGLTAFALANVAILLAFSTWLAPWLAAVVLTVAWCVVGGGLALVLRGRVKQATTWSADVAEEARASGEEVRETLERLTVAVTREIALAAVPVAGDVAEGLVDAGDELIESADDAIETLMEDIPGGGVVNQMWDIVLMPGRLGIRVATTFLRIADTKG
jgi:Putative Actinobacterial Holin-X, holin superfamily III